MQLILFLVGLPMLVMGRLRFGGYSQSGPVVRAAGVLLMLPFAASLIFTGLLFMISENWTAEARRSFLIFQNILLLVGQILAIFAAWRLLRRGTGSASAPPPASIVSGFARRVEGWQSSARREKEALRQQPPVQRVNPADFPSVMNTRQAAAYLQVPEQTVLELIHSGKLIAAHINQRYTIARSVLDEYRDGQQDDDQGAGNQ